MTGPAVGPLGPALALEHPRVVLHEEGHMVHALQTLMPEELGNAIGGRFVLPEGRHLPARGHDDRRLVGVGLRELSSEHA